MGTNRKCPKCGSQRVQMSSTSKSHGCLWMLLFGVFYVFWVIFKWIIGLMFLICFDWWMAIIKSSQNKGYVWQAEKWFAGDRKYYYCHDCGHNFKA